MIEPTETESKETLDAFIDVMHRIAEKTAHEWSEQENAAMNPLNNLHRGRPSPYRSPEMRADAC